MKIDIFNHFLPAKYKEALSKTLLPPIFQSFQVRGEMFPALVDVEKRFLLLDKHEGLVQALSMISPFVERYVSPGLLLTWSGWETTSWPSWWQNIRIGLWPP